MAEATICLFCAFLRIQDFDTTKIEVDVTPDEPTTTISNERTKTAKKQAKKRLSDKDKKLRKIMNQLIILLGHGQIVRSIPEAVAALLLRNYPDLVMWNGETKLVIFVPDYYLTKAIRYVDPKHGEQVMKKLEAAARLNPDRKDELAKRSNALIGAKRVHRGEVPERNLYDALKDYCAKTDESIAVFHGLDILKFDPNRQNNNVNEKDFILVSASYGYIMVIECKKTLGTGESIEKSLQQLQDTKKDLESYFRYGISDTESEMSGDWIFIPMIHFEELEDSVNYCQSCEKHIIKGIITYSRTILFRS